MNGAEGLRFLIEEKLLRIFLADREEDEAWIPYFTTSVPYPVQSVVLVGLSVESDSAPGQGTREQYSYSTSPVRD